ncbi:MAG TPA: sigma-70 family RNA polymerase sigma factor [Candidatus Nitrosotalea sp.]|nr:sigma-70 family RNA polymerase sigma factor [Candidatus Nitrosotalea sp.]
MSERSDAQLVSAHRAGEPGAFEELHRRYVGSIYRLVHRRLGDRLLAEDIAQETFLKALRSLDRVDESFNFGGWVHTVARNLCFDELRRRQRDPRVTDESEDGDLMVRLPSVSLAFDPVHQSEQAELRRQVFQVAERLPEKYRLVLTLRELQGLSYRRIGQAMQLSESAVETLLYRARLRFKEEFLAAGNESELDCGRARSLLAPYLAGKLRRGETELVRAHLARCSACSRLAGLRRPPAGAGRQPR